MTTEIVPAVVTSFDEAEQRERLEGWLAVMDDGIHRIYERGQTEDQAIARVRHTWTVNRCVFREQCPHG